MAENQGNARAMGRRTIAFRGLFLLRLLPFLVLFALTALRPAWSAPMGKDVKTPPPAVPPAAQPPVIDGLLDDPAWASALKFDAFLTFKPDYGKECSQKTVVYVTYDAENLYFACRAYDTEPSKIKTSICKRDAAGADDLFGIIVDTFNDMQSGFTFMVNPHGIQGDGILNIQGNVDDSQDMVWYSRGLVDEAGWTSEVRVPLKSIRFPGGKAITMRLMFFRFLTRTSEQVTFPPFDPGKGGFLMQTMPLVFSGLKYKRVAEVLPAFTYGSRYAASGGSLVRTEENKDLSLTAKVGLTSDLMFDGTYNPDFSQVEADAGQVDINLRYQLYYQEKRPFFLESTDLWNFGAAVEDGPVSSIVYTRTIVNPDFGFKLTGKITPRDTVAVIYARDSLPGNSYDENPDFTIVRYKHSLKGDSYLGGFYTGKGSGDGYNRVGGLDGMLRLSNRSTFSFHYFGSFTREADDGDGPTDNDHALGLDYSFGDRKWAIDLGYQDVSPDFRIDTGFVTRTGVRRISAFAMYQIYPKSRFFQKIEPFYWSYHLYDTSAGLWETCNFFVLRFRLPRSTMVRFDGIVANEVFSGTRFDTSGVGFRTETQILKRVYLEFSLRRQGSIYYDPEAPFQGYGTTVSSLLRYQPVDKVDLRLTLAYNDLYRRADHRKVYDYTLIRSWNTFQINKYLFVRGIVEYNIYRKRMAADALVSFTYIPGTVFFVGYGSAYERIAWNGDEYTASDRYTETKRGFFLKISYLWRL